MLGVRQVEELEAAGLAHSNEKDILRAQLSEALDEVQAERERYGFKVVCYFSFSLAASVSKEARPQPRRILFLEHQDSSVAVRMDHTFFFSTSLAVVDAHHALLFATCLSAEDLLRQKCKGCR